MNWTAEKLKGEIAAMRVRLEEEGRDNEDKINDVLYMMTLIVSDDDPLYLRAQNELEELQREEAGDDPPNVIGYSHWLIANQPIVDDSGEPVVYTFNDLVREYPLNGFTTFWHKSIYADGDDILVCGINPMADTYHVTKYAGVEDQIVFVRDADDKIDQVNREQMP